MSPALEDSGGFIAFALTVEALHARRFRHERGFVSTFGGALQKLFNTSCQPATFKLSKLWCILWVMLLVGQLNSNFGVCSNSDFKHMESMESILFSNANTKKKQIVQDKLRWRYIKILRQRG